MTRYRKSARHSNLPDIVASNIEVIGVRSKRSKCETISDGIANRRKDRERIRKRQLLGQKSMFVPTQDKKDDVETNPLSLAPEGALSPQERKSAFRRDRMDYRKNPRLTV